MGQKTASLTYIYTSVLVAVALSVAAFANLGSGLNFVVVSEFVIAAYLFISVWIVRRGVYVSVFSNILLYLVAALLLYNTTAIASSDPGPYVGLAGLVLVAHFMLSSYTQFVAYNLFVMLVYSFLFLQGSIQLPALVFLKISVVYIVTIFIVQLNRRFHTKEEIKDLPTRHKDEEKTGVYQSSNIFFDLLNKIFGRASISIKVIALSSLLAFVFLGSTAFFIIYTARNQLVESSLKLISDQIDHESDIFDIIVNDAILETISISKTPPFQGIVRARDGGGYDGEGGSTYSQWKERLETIFSAQMVSTKEYAQLRYLDELGNEIVRVDYNGIEISVVPDEQLQNKYDRDYFIQGSTLDSGSVYTSPVELNREGNPPVISEPLTPVVRVVTPIYSKDTGEFKGMFIANVLFNSVLEKSGPHRESVGGLNMFVVDDEGYLLAYPDKDKLWGSPENLNTGHSLYTEFPHLPDDFITSGAEIIENEHVILHESESHLEDRQWHIIGHVDTDIFLESLNRTIAYWVVAAGATFVLFFFIFQTFIQALFKPLYILRDASKSIGEGNFNINIPVSSQDEVGSLTKSINDMASQLKDLYANLEKKVIEKTKDLEKFQLAVENASDHIIITDVEGTTLYANKGAEKLTGFSKEEIVGNKAGDSLWGGQMENDFYKKMWHTIKVEKKTFKGEIINRRKNGKKYTAYSTVSPVLDGNGDVEFFVGIERDITREKEVEQAKSDFVSIASHQLRTPMTGIRWVIERFKKKEKLSKQGKEYLTDIQRSVERLAELVDSLLNVSRIESTGGVGVSPKKLDAVTFVNNYLKETDPLVEEKNITLSFSEHPKEVEMTTDPTILRNIIQSLVSNAIEYTNSGGTVTVTLSEPKDGVVTFSVSDTGIGIPKGDQDKLFMKFYRAENAKLHKPDGSGLGLYIVKEAVGLLGGEISFTSGEGEGTTFTVKLPCVSQRRDGEKTLLV